jgi:FKBP-type peptidyl-prolyl cis-trans isomerase SlyD
MEIEKHTVVSLRYVMKNAEAEVMEDTMDAAPVQFVHGSGNILPGLESSLKGLKPGETKTLSISDERLSGIFYFAVVIDHVRAASSREIDTGKPALDSECGPGCCC